MAVEGPFLAAMIARMSEPKLNLAAYGIAFSLGLLAESPIINALSAATALVQDHYTYKKLRRFIFGICIGITVLLLIGLIPAAFDGVMIPLFDLSKKLSGLVYGSLWALLPWPAAIGIRRFYQGVLISQGHAKNIALATLGRILVMFATCLLLMELSTFSGAVIATFALSTGVVCEALFVRFAARKCINLVLARELSPADRGDLGLKELTKFYLPLALTPLLALAAQPVVTFFTARGVNALESLAVIPVITSFVFFFRAIGLSYQEVVISFSKRGPQFVSYLNRLAVVIGAVACGLYLLLVFSPFLEMWLTKVAHLRPELKELAVWPLWIQGLFVPAVVLLNWQRATLIYRKKTVPISVATVVEILSLIVAMAFGVFYFEWYGALAAAVAIVVSRTLACAYLQWKIRVT